MGLRPSYKGLLGYLNQVWFVVSLGLRDKGTVDFMDSHHNGEVTVKFMYFFKKLFFSTPGHVLHKLSI